MNELYSLILFKVVGHFLGSALLSYIFCLKSKSTSVGFSVAISLGIIKEVYDKYIERWAEGPDDIFIDYVGCMVGILLYTFSPEWCYKKLKFIKRVLDKITCGLKLHTYKMDYDTKNKAWNEVFGAKYKICRKCGKMREF